MELQWDHIPAKHPQPGVTTRRQDFTHMTVVLYEFGPNATFPMHSHGEEQIVVMIAGSCRFGVGDGETPLTGGGAIVAPPHVSHGCKAGPEGCRFLNILSPRRIGDGNITYNS